MDHHTPAPSHPRSDARDAEYRPATPAVRLGGVLAFLVGCDSMIIAPLAPDVLGSWSARLDLGALLVAAYALAYTVTSPFFGALADHVGRRRIATTGVLVFALGTALTATAWNLYAGLFFRAVAGLGAGMIMPTVFAEVATRSGPADRSRHIGTVMGMLLASTVIGVPLGAYLAAAMSWRWVFVLLAVTAALLAIPGVGVFSQEAPHSIPGPAAFAVRRMLTTALTTPRLLWVLLATFWWNTGLAVLFSAIGAFYRDRYDLGPNAMGTVILAAGAASVLGAMVGGRIALRLGTSAYFTLAATVAAAGVLTTVLTPHALAATIAGHILWSLAIGAGQPVLTTLAAGLDPRLQGTALALNGSTQYFAQFTAATIGATLLITLHSYTTLGVLAAASAILAAGSVLLTRRTTRR